MASISEIQSGAETALLSPEAQQPPGGAVVSDLPSWGWDPAPQHQSLPDICNLAWQREGMPDTEFNRKYSPDPWGDEAGPNARVWKVYRDQQEISHNGSLEGWNKTLDVLLIFAGLFSAVLTAFLIESYKALQPDYTQYVAVFLYAAAVSNNRTGGVFPALDDMLAPDRFVQTSVAQRWTNGLWFSSLVISLAVALLCILIKQWLDAYNSHVSAVSSSPRDWARRHTLYHRGLVKWGVPRLISFLPLLLHLSLFLFCVGLILFLRPLDGAISYSVLIMVLNIATFYVLSLVMPAWRIDCPSYTPLLAQAQLAVYRAISGLLYVIGRGYRPGPLYKRLARSSWATSAEDWLYSVQPRFGQQLARDTGTISDRAPHLDGQVLSDLIQLPTDTNRDAVDTAFAAIGAITSTITIEFVSREVPANVVWRKLHTSLQSLRTSVQETGFAITSRAQLHRAHMAMSLQESDELFHTVEPTPCVPSLGIDGLLLQGLRIRDADRQRSGIDFLFSRLQYLHVDGDISRGFPLRSTCLLFLDFFARDRFWHSSLGVYCLLIFCAGRFASAEMHELVRALRSIEVLLDRMYSITIPAHNGQDNDYVGAVVDGLWLMLTDSTRCHIDLLTAQIIAYHALACFKKIDRGYSGALATFIRSPIFSQYMATTNNVNEYVLVIRYGRRHLTLEEPLEDYWSCIATLLKLSWECVPRPEQAVWLYNPLFLLPVDPNDGNLTYRFKKGGPFAERDDWYESGLSAILGVVSGPQ